MIRLNELGTRLKEARIEKGYSLEDLQDITKIQKRYLAGIEEGNYSMMPGQFYVRAFIKQYAEAVDLNADELLEQHKSEVPETEKETVRPTMAPPTPSRRETFSRSSSNRLSEVMPMIMVVLFIVLIIAVAWFFYNQLSPNDTPEEITDDGGVQYEAPDEGEPADSEDTEQPAAQEEPAEETPVEPVEEEEPAEEEPTEPESSMSVVGTEAETTTYTWTGPADRELQIAAAGASWVSATSENGAELMSPARTMQQGESETIDVTGVSQVRVRLGASQNVTVSVNGEPIEYQQDRTTQNIVIQFKNAE